MYDMIFKRRSFHNFRNRGIISDEQLKEIREFIDNVEQLNKDIKVLINIVPESETSCHANGEYCILFYSETKGEYQRNIGYIGEQIDLFLAERNIGACWYGMGKAEEKEKDGLSFVILMSIGAVEESAFRKDVKEFKRKSLSDIWKGDDLGIGETVRLAPSAVNSQPWYVENTGSEIRVYRKRRNPLVPLNMNKVDMGIFLYILECCLKKQGIEYERTLYDEQTADKLTAVYSY